jgi:small GTP-binding protein
MSNKTSNEDMRAASKKAAQCPAPYDCSDMKPIVAIVGRPNVGKSTFFNRVTGKRNALVDDFPGVTRDRHYGDAVWNDVDFTLVDTGGFPGEDEDGLARKIRSQILQAIEDADAMFFMRSIKSMAPNRKIDCMSFIVLE